MRLFEKTFLFFISVILLESILIIIIVTNIIKTNNLEDARRELIQEAETLYENYNSWKRNIWVNLVSLENSQQVENNSKNISGYVNRTEMVSHLKENLLVKGFDAFTLISPDNHTREVFILTSKSIEIPDVYGLRVERTHPYIQSMILGNYLFMVGKVRVRDEYNNNIDILIFKRIDEAFCSTLIVTGLSQVMIFLEDKHLVGTWGGFQPDGSIGLTKIESAYKGLYNIDLEGKSYNIAVQKIESISEGKRTGQLYLITFVSNKHYRDRLNLIRTTVLYVCLLAAIVSAAFSLFLSQKICNPIKNLLWTMKMIKNGQYDIRVSTKSMNEIGELFKGFNDMALKLSQDKTAMESYIREIVLLKDYNEKIINSIKAGIAIISTDLRVEKTNRFFLDFFSLEYDRIIGRKIEEVGNRVIDSDILCKMEDIIQLRRDFYSKIKRVSESKVTEIKLYPFYSSDDQHDSVHGCVLIADDISKKVEFEEKIFQAEKLSSISMLSAGVAHEINNPLSSIMTNVQNLISEDNDKEHTIVLRLIEQETRRIERIVRELLDFASSKDRGSSWSDINEVITQVLNLIRFSVKKEGFVLLESSLARNIPFAAIERVELKQVIMNLLNNSLQAIDREGKIKVSTLSNKTKSQVIIMVQDNGSGIKQDILPHIFDPFFTTKQENGGTGLGLSIVYGIVKKYQGTINIKSRESSGTTVNIALPVYREK